MFAKKYLVTGGTGFIGRNVTRAMVRNGYTTRVLDNNSRGNLESLKDIVNDFEFISGDVRDPKIVNIACKGVDGVIHLAAVNGTKFFYSMPEVVLDVSTRGIINVIDSCLWNGVDEIYFASSSEVYQTPPVVPTPENVRLIVPDLLNPRYSYGGGKIISELFVANYGRKYFRRAMIFRPHNVFGPEMGWEHVIPQFVIRMRELSKKDHGLVKFHIQGSGKETRAFVYIDDFVKGLETIIKHGKHLEIYNIGTDQEIAINEVAQGVADFFGQKIKIIPGKIQKGGTNRRLPDISKIRKLGYQPKFSFYEGLQITADWYNNNAHLKPPALII
ncbi:MAG: NAD-dependent epimerase/dehydratase family protein [Patescibacteria group bacterium]